MRDKSVDKCKKKKREGEREGKKFGIARVLEITTAATVDD